MANCNKKIIVLDCQSIFVRNGFAVSREKMVEMKIGIMSDTHGRWAAIDNVVCLAGKTDMWLHCGDCVPDAEYLQELVTVPVYFVAGNCDWPMGGTCYERIIDVEGHRIFLTHGHNYGVRYTREYIMEAAESQGADIAVYGHTHVVDYKPGSLVVLNPGSAARPRDDNRGSFMIMELFKDIEPKISIIRMEK